jgi:hypothetical protein
MKKENKARFFILAMLLLPLVGIAAQDDLGDFGFGESDGFGFQAPLGISVSIGGQVRSELTAFYDDFGSAERIKSTRLGDVFSGSLNFEATGSAAQAFIFLNLNPSSSPVEIDEAFVRTFFGAATVEGGLRKLFWGKADSFGPLDVINPLDYSDLTKLSNPAEIKIARPMIHAFRPLGSFSKLEAVFVPWFRGHNFAASGRWAPKQMTEMVPNLVGGLKIAMLGINPSLSNYFNDLDNWQNNFDIDEYYSDQNRTLEYAQAGMRFTSTVGSSDLGFQYYFGRFPRPKVNAAVDGYVRGLLSSPPVSDPNRISIDIDHDYYHQIGADFARVIAGFNLRAEAGANITGDLDGSDGTIENPSLVWSLGFDRDLFWGIKLNLQGTGLMRLFHGKIIDDPLRDCEADSGMSSTRITGIVSRKFLSDELELKISGLWGIEDRDFLVMPALGWSRNDVSAELSAGFFGGDISGELGQYRDNSFVRLRLSYSF